MGRNLKSVKLIKTLCTDNNLTITDTTEDSRAGEDEHQMMEKVFSYGSTTLIQLVEQKPCLWDSSSDDYKNKMKKEKAWKEIYCTIEPGFENLSAGQQASLGQQISKKWSNIRDSYVKWIRHGKRTKPYVYHEFLSFLGYQLLGKLNEDRSQSANFSEYDDLDETNQGEDTTNDDFGLVDTNLEYNEDDVLEVPIVKDAEDHGDESTSDPLFESTHSRSRTKGKSSKRRAKNDPTAEVLLKLLKKSEDDDEAFFYSILPSVKKMNEDTKMEFRMEAMKLIQRLQKPQTTKRKTRQVKTEITDSE